MQEEEEGMTEDEAVGWHHQLNGHEFEQALENDEGQRSLACCNPQDCKELDTTEQLNNNYPFCTKQSSFSREYLLISLVVHFPSSPE